MILRGEAKGAGVEDEQSAAEEAHEIVRPLADDGPGSLSQRHEQGGVLTVHVGPIKRDKHQDYDGRREPSHAQI
jgi:hypothetical protein